uniref:COBRA-like protein n=1 Tax=Anthurium amnicola TaxID=1678845 RepID=A0A1D1YE18_9ARAE
MKLFYPCGRRLLVMAPLVLLFNISADCYDTLDPNGNITVTFDIDKWTDDGYMARVTLHNYYLYRHVESPGWKLGWAWGRGEVIWSMAGALATQQGNCSRFPSRVPYSCKRSPVVVDLPLDAPSENRSAGCCRGGILAASAIDPTRSLTSFELVVGNLGKDPKTGVPVARPPGNLTLMAPGPGYTCGPLEDESPTVIPVAGGQREEQVFRTWKSSCTYSLFQARGEPPCCVSLSTFYNPDVTPCPSCSCGCEDQGSATSLCTRWEAPTAPGNATTSVWCTDHMCPVQVHWHIKNNYRDHWRVKLTVSNYNYVAKYSDWNVVVQHPGFRQPTKAGGFNTTKLPAVAGYNMGEVALFWGMEGHNTELLKAGEEEPGSVTTDILIGKDEAFTLRNGWAFPRKAYFNGDSCEMPMPDSFPGLPPRARG